MAIQESSVLSAREARANFASVLERAQAGEIITVAAHGVPRAQIGPITGHVRSLTIAELAGIRRLERDARFAADMGLLDDDTDDGLDDEA